jgi:hypothetical protein
LAVFAGCEAEKEMPVAQQYVYTVRDGDGSLKDIAHKVYGADGHVALIEQANPECKGQAPKPGTKLVVPPLVTKDGTVTPPKECDRKPVY